MGETPPPAELLLVEDNPDDLELILRSLSRPPFQGRVFAVRDGAEALDFLFGTGIYASRAGNPPPKVILLDLKLPKVTGKEVLKRVRSDERLRRVPVVILTSSRQERDVAESYALGANSYVVKPVRFDELSRVIGQTGLYWTQFNHPAA